MTATTARVSLPFLESLADARKGPLATARVLKRRADALNLSLRAGSYISKPVYDGDTGAACLIGTLTLDLVKQLNNIEFDDGELIGWLFRSNPYEWDEPRPDDPEATYIPNYIADRKSLYEFIMDATQSVDFESLQELERGFESNAVNYGNIPDAYDRRARQMDATLAAVQQGWIDDPTDLLEDRVPSAFNAAQREAWRSESRAFKTGYYLRLMGMGLIS